MSLEQVLEAIVRRVLREELAAMKPAALLTVEDYADARSISQSTVRAAIREGRLEATRIGRSVRVASGAEISKSLSSDLENSPAVRAARKLGLAVVK